MTLALGVLALALLASGLLAVSVDRSSRATAWRQIALERRWNHEHRSGATHTR